MCARACVRARVCVWGWVGELCVCMCTRCVCERELCVSELVVSKSRARAHTVSRDDLIFHVLSALAGCTDNDEELTPAGAQVAFVGVGEGYTVLEDDALRPWFDRIAVEGGAGGGGGGGGAAPAAAAAMDVDG